MRPGIRTVMGAENDQFTARCQPSCRASITGAICLKRPKVITGEVRQSHKKGGDNPPSRFVVRLAGTRTGWRDREASNEDREPETTKCHYGSGVSISENEEDDKLLVRFGACLGPGWGRWRTPEASEAVGRNKGAVGCRPST